MRLERARLEDWLRDYYFTTSIDLGGSGVQCWTLAELRELTGTTTAELDAISLDDSDTFGSTELRAALAARWTAGDVSRVMATHGSTEAIFVVMASLLEAGDEVVVLRPCYHALSAVAKGVGCQLVPWPLRPEQDFQPDLDELRNLVSHRTKMIVVNFPHNPTGVTITTAQQQQLVAIAAGIDAYLVWDAAFTELTYGTPPLPDPSECYRRCVSLGTLSKAYGLPGLRVGWCLGDPELLAQFIPLRDRLTICLSPVVELLAARAVKYADLLIGPRLAQAARNLSTLGDWADSMAAKVELTRPGGGVTVFPRLDVSDVDALCRHMCEDEGILVVPGSCFGDQSRIRLGFGSSSSTYAHGLTQLGKAIERG